MMTVSQLRDIVTRFNSLKGKEQSKKITRQKLGFSYSQTFNSLDSVIDTIVASALLKANLPLQEDSWVRIPVWMTKKTFNSFISKISNYANHV